jgi:hypothetical protein
VSYHAFLDRGLLLLLTGKLLNQRYLVVKLSLLRKFDGGRYHDLIFKIYSSKNVIIIKSKIKLLRHNFCNDNRFLLAILFWVLWFH